MNKKFELNIEMTLKEFKKINKKYISRFWEKFLITSSIILLITLMALFSPEPILISEYIIANTFFISVALIIILVYETIKTNLWCKKYIESDEGIVKYKLVFYNDAVEKITENESIKIKYIKIKKIYETIDNFVIKFDKLTNFIIKKENLNDENIEFIKGINNGNPIKLKSTKIKKKVLSVDEKNYRKIKVLLIILFILTIASLWISFGVAMFVSYLKNGNLEYAVKDLWIMYLFLPLPIISIILGFKYRNIGIKCTKNIVAGFIISFLLIIYGSFESIFKYNPHIQQFSLEEYKYIINTEVPQKGVYQRIEWGSSYLIDHVSNYATFGDESEIKQFNNFVFNNQNWILDSELSSVLEIFLTSSIKNNGDGSYYSIYIKELKEYNVIPSEEGTYNIVSMKYNPNNSSLSIEEFKYSFKL